MRFRIGIHLGDVIHRDDGTVYGDGVDVAARIQALAGPGGIVASDAICAVVRGHTALRFVDRGERRLKNIARPVRIHAVGRDAAEGSKRALRQRQQAKRASGAAPPRTATFPSPVEPLISREYGDPGARRARRPRPVDDPRRPRWHRQDPACRRGRQRPSGELSGRRMVGRSGGGVDGRARSAGRRPGLLRHAARRRRRSGAAGPRLGRAPPAAGARQLRACACRRNGGSRPAPRGDRRRQRPGDVAGAAGGHRRAGLASRCARGPARRRLARCCPDVRCGAAVRAARAGGRSEVRARRGNDRQRHRHLPETRRQRAWRSRWPRPGRRSSASVR